MSTAPFGRAEYFFKQYVAGVVSNIGVFCFGTAVGWINSGARVAEQEGYSHGPRVDEMKLTGLMLPLGAACFCMPMGLLIGRYGCKAIMLMQLVPYAVGWVLLICANNVYMVYVARYLLGICGAALCIAVPMYNAEIARLQQRGSMVSMFYGAFVYGIVFNNIMADLIGIQYANILCLLAAAPYSAVKFIPESPAYLFLNGRVEEAVATIRWLRGNLYDASTELIELKLSMTGSQGNIRRGPCKLLRNRRNMRSWPRSVMILLVYQLSGGLIINNHILDMLDRIDTCCTINLYSMYLSFCLGHLICFLLVDRLGRRPLMLFSSVFMCVCSLFLWIWFMWLENASHLLAIISYELFFGFFSMGIGPLSWTLYVELIIEPVRPYGCALAATISWAVATVLSIKYTYNMSHQAIFLFIFIMCALGLLIIIIFMPEVKGMSSVRIQEMLPIHAFDETPSNEESS